MRTIGLFALSTFLFSAAVTAVVPDYIPGGDNYPNKVEIKNETKTGFTIEYKRYYKVLTNNVANRTYCLVGWGEGTPVGCNSETTLSTPVKRLSFDADSISVGPFIELLGLQNKIATAVHEQNITSPCIIEGSKNDDNQSPDVYFSNRQEKFHVAFSGNSDTLGPLQKAFWLVYLGAFFDMESEAFAAYSQIEVNYNCHKEKLGKTSTPKGISWTSFDPVAKIYTINGDQYYDQLSQDAGGKLVLNNRLQDHTFKTDMRDLDLLSKALNLGEYIIDISDPNVTYQTWYTNGHEFFNPDSNDAYPVIKAIVNKQVYTMNGLLNSFGASDWVQRSSARPDLALMDLIKLLYSSAEVPDKKIFPFWISQFENVLDNRRIIQAESYGNCSSMMTTASAQAICYLSDGGSIHQPDLTSGGKAGISVGVILFIILTACVGTWLFRRHRRNQRHNFYRMNDLQ
ncbi:hypothetical protein HPULCUR_008101 [Helicostylum pulchrum]|uniref:Periplasmic binding protein n=1 Tax=Helicostylum pulchrum TaxID=562976 RepID=A0ABP9Y7T2_9FUNG